MNKIQCDNCMQYFPAEEVMHCEHCGKCYCPDCAYEMCICECSGDLTYFD